MGACFRELSIVRVEPRGERYSVFILDESAETDEATATPGPYDSR